MTDTEKKEYSQIPKAAFLAGFTEAFKELEAVKAKGDDDHQEPKTAAIKQISQIPNVFQPRCSNVNEKHVSDLLVVLKSGKQLDAVTVWRCGKHVILLDGHHRMAAYQRHQKETKTQQHIPLSWFNGSAEEALRASESENVKSRLPMDSEQRAACAWRLVKSGRFTKPDIAKRACVSTGLVANMRKAVAGLGDRLEDHWTWRKAWSVYTDKLSSMSSEDLEAWEDQKAKEIADRLARTFSTKLSDDTAITAKALVIYFGRKGNRFIRDLAAEMGITDLEVEDDDFDEDGLPADSITTPF